jgi:hypothetical protein
VVKIVGSNQYNQRVTFNPSKEIKWVVSYHKGASAILAMCLYLTVVTWEGSKALSSGGSRQVAPSLEATFIGE